MRWTVPSSIELDDPALEICTLCNCQRADAPVDLHGRVIAPPISISDSTGASRLPVEAASTSAPAAAARPVALRVSDTLNATRIVPATLRPTSTSSI